MNATVPDTDRVAASKAAVAARRARAEVKQRVRDGELSPLTVLEQSGTRGTPASTLRVTEFVLLLPAIGQVKMPAILRDLAISERKRLGGLGSRQRIELEKFVRERLGIELPTGLPPLTVLAGPTAVGKGTVAAYIREHYPEVRLSISATTRPARPGEIDGVHYYFVTDEEFDRMLAESEFLEWATVHNAYRYGTPRTPVIEAASRGERMLLEIDLQGARQVSVAMPDARLVFLAPPTWEELVKRLTGRGTESVEEQERRLATARIELAAADEFDEIIVNDTVALAAERLVAIMSGEPTKPAQSR